MADFIKTISNSMRLLGGGPSSKWGQANYPYTFTWGVTKWGEGSFRVVFSADKLISNSILPSTIVVKEVEKLVSEVLSLDSEMASEIASNGIWRIVFVSDTINVVDRDTASWTSGTNTSTSFTCLVAGSTNWT